MVSDVTIHYWTRRQITTTCRFGFGDWAGPGDRELPVRCRDVGPDDVRDGAGCVGLRGARRCTDPGPSGEPRQPSRRTTL